MRRVYEFTRALNGETRLEIVMLLSPKECDIDQILHRVGLEFCISPQGRRLCKGASELTFEELMSNLTPEMLAPYGVSMYRVRDEAQQMDNAAPVVSRYEMELYQGITDKHNRQFCALRDYGERIAKRLEAQRLRGHPAISTWNPNLIPGRAIAWAYLFITGSEQNFEKFFNRKLQEAKPHTVTGVNPPAGTGEVCGSPEEQQAEQAFQ